MSEQVEHINPYGGTGAKHRQVRRMFDSIAPAYDVMNRMMTLGIDRQWRARAVNGLAESAPARVLDIATGTGDLAIAIARRLPGSRVTGVDLSEGMIAVGRDKVRQAGLADRVTLQAADALHLPFADGSFDAVTVAYGVRNFEHIDRGYAEMLRVLRPGGRLCVIELTPPKSAWVKPFYAVYTRAVIPLVGRLVSHDRRAYTYLPQSIRAVPARGRMLDLIMGAGFADARCHDLTFGVCAIYTATKPPVGAEPKQR